MSNRRTAPGERRTLTQGCVQAVKNLPFMMSWALTCHRHDFHRQRAVISVNFPVLIRNGTYLRLGQG